MNLQLFLIQNSQLFDAAKFLLLNFSLDLCKDIDFV
jgi:hypothetical protein